MSNEIAILSDGNFLPAGSITPQGLLLPEDLDVDGWVRVGERLSQAEQAMQWWIGDWWRFGDGRFGNAADIAAALGIAPETLRGYAYTAGAVDPVRRSTDLSYGHHRVVAPLSDEDQSRFLTQAADEGWSVAELTRQVRSETRDRSEEGEGRSSKKSSKDAEERFAENRDAAVFSVTQAATRLGDAVVVIRQPGFRMSVSVAQDLVREVAKVDQARGELLEFIDDECGSLGVSVPSFTAPKKVIKAAVATAGNPYLKAGEQQKVSLGGLSDSIGDQTITIEDYYAQVGR